MKVERIEAGRPAPLGATPVDRTKVYQPAEELEDDEFAGFSRVAN